MRHLKRLWMIWIIFITAIIVYPPTLPTLIHAQDGEDTPTLAEPTRVEIEASDGLMLVGDFYAASTEDDEPVPAILLLHMLSSNRTAWEPVLPVLVAEYQFAVLNIDMRGHGETGGSQEWTLAEADVQTLIDWLREQDGIDPDAVSIVGASIGSNLAIRGWSNDENVATAVALSPGLDYRGVTTANAVEIQPNRPIMLVASRNDFPSATAINDLYDLTSGYAAVRMYDGNLHGTNLFRDEAITNYLAYAIAEWVDENSQE
jgi:pimeloyl-ACP methyl ester carboxylesterase